MDSHVYSMAPIIALSFDKIKLKGCPMFMFHDYKTMAIGSGHEIESNTRAMRTVLTTLLEENCTPFLTKKEISSIMKGNDMYFLGDDAVKRIKRHNKR